MPLTPGIKLGPYEIVAPLGAGGMGEVYRARDTRLDRTVAIKVISSHLSVDPLRRQRFEREAKAISALQHPNICTLYDVGHQDGTDYLVMEYLEGQTMAARLALGALPLEQTLRYGIEIADALDTAHRRGIVHRDLKPGNVMITTHGECKVLDFGLAKIEAEADSSDAETATRQAVLTSPGVALGTVAYMSPEQVRGDELDARTDIFSLGTVLYEMASGKMPFVGKTSAMVFKAILDEVPAVPSRLNSAVPGQLDEILRKALEKDRDLRYQSAADLRTDLKRVKRDTESARHAPDSGSKAITPEKRRSQTALWAAMATVVAIIAAGLWWYMRHRDNAQFVERQITTSSSEDPVDSQAISPDGKYIAYSDSGGIHLRVIASGEEHDLEAPGGPGHMLISWFPDGNALLLNTLEAGQGLQGTPWKVPILGGTATKLREHALFPVISPDGTQIAFFSEQNQVWLMDAQGGNAHMAFSTSGLLVALQWSPDAKYLAYEKIGDDGSVSIEVRRRDGIQAAALPYPHLSTEFSLRWLPDWNLVYSTFAGHGSYDANLWMVSIDSATGRSKGQPKQLTHWTDGYYPGYVNSTSDGKVISAVKMSAQLDVYIGQLSNQDRTLDKPQRFTLDNRDDVPDTWTPDGRAMLIESNRSGVYNIYRQEIGKVKAERLFGTVEIEAARAVYTPDGAWILYETRPKAAEKDKPGDFQLMRAPVAGGSSELLQGGIHEQRWTGTFDCPSARNAFCVITEGTDKEIIFFELDPLKGKGRELARAEHKSNGYFGWAISKDGTALAVVNGNDPYAEIIELKTGARHKIPLPHDWVPQAVTWSNDGKALFTTVWTPKASVLGRIELTGETQVLKLGPTQWMNGVVVSPDGRYLAYAAQTWDNNVWLLERK